MRAGRRLADRFDELVDDPEEGRPIAPDNLLLVGEVVPPGSKDEWGDKMTDYADAGIPWYLIVQDTADGYRAELHRLSEAAGYELVETAEPAGSPRLPEPFDGSIDMSTLEPRKR